MPYAPGVTRTMIADLRQQRFDLRAALAGVHCPTLIVHGRQDAIPEGVGYQIREAMPQTQLRFVEKCGHFAWIEQPEVLFTELRRFLASK